MWVVRTGVRWAAEIYSAPGINRRRGWVAVRKTRYRGISLSVVEMYQ